MNSLDKLFTEEQVVTVSDKILAKVLPDIQKNLTSVFYKELQEYLFEHYENSSDEIKRSLIKDLSDNFVQDPKNYKFKSIRDKLFTENKEVLTKVLTEEFVESAVTSLILFKFSDNNFDGYRWKEGVVTFIKQNWNTFKDDTIIENSLLNVIKQLNYRIESLESALKEDSDEE